MLLFEFDCPISLSEECRRRQRCKDREGLLLLLFLFLLFFESRAENLNTSTDTNHSSQSHREEAPCTTHDVMRINKETTPTAETESQRGDREISELLQAQCLDTFTGKCEFGDG